MADFTLPLIELVFDEQRTPLIAVDPDEFCYEIGGRIIDYSNPLDPVSHVEERLAGKFRLYFVDLERAMEAGIAMSDTLCEGAGTRPFVGVLLDESGNYFSNQVCALLEEDFSGMSLLIIDRLEILPSYRGRNLGLFVLRRLLERYALSAAIVGLQVAPLQFLSEPDDGDERWWWQQMDYNATSRDREAATRKLKSHYSRLGFKALPGTSLMFMSGYAALSKPSGLIRLSRGGD